MAQGHKFQDLEETGEVLVAFINSSQLEKLKRVKDEHQALFNQHVETKKIVRQILKGNRTFSDLLLLSVCVLAPLSAPSSSPSWTSFHRCGSDRGDNRPEAARHGGGEEAERGRAVECGGTSAAVHGQEPDDRL